MKLFFKFFVLLFCFQVSAQIDKKFDEGLIKFIDKDFEKAIDAFNGVIKLDPKNHEAHYYIGVCNIKLKFYKKALANFDRAIELNPKYSKAYYNRGVARFYLSDNFSGCVDFKKAVEIDPTYDEAIKSIREFCN
jgi:tetratricopeptide (TPR) repeat protein